MRHHALEPSVSFSYFSCKRQLAKREAKEEALRRAEVESENERLDDWKMSLGKSLPGERDKPEHMRDINEASEDRFSGASEAPPRQGKKATLPSRCKKLRLTSGS